MEDAYVYFNGNNIYNAIDMSFIASISNTSRSTIYKVLRKITSKYNVKMFIIDFNQLVRNEIYCLNPNANVIIAPIFVKRMITENLNFLLENKNINDEVAITNDKEGLVCNWIYNYNNKKDALKYYNAWQMHVPIKTIYYHNIIMIIDYFKDEVFNYFDNKQSIDELYLLN